MRINKTLFINKLLGAVMVLLILSNYRPMLVAAESTTPAPAPKTTSAAAAKTGPQKPAGADANTYHLNESTGKWENDHYIWDPVTKQTQPKVTPSYSYNPKTNMWDTTKYAYDAPSGTYKPNVASVSKSPTTTQPAQTAKNPEKANTTNNTFDLYYNASISNNISQDAKTGNALVESNTTAGNALTGNAESIATILNMLQSSVNFGGNGQPITFVSNIQGNVVGDLLINPNLIATQLQTANNTTPSTNNLQVKAQNDGLINNKITLSSTSGDAGINRNTTAGSAQTGSAYSMANVVNVMNSAIGAGQSFLGTINIYGNLNGDILLPPSILQALAAANAKPATSNLSAVSSNTSANITNNQNIANNVVTDVASGKAGVSNNTSAGNATSGTATSNITLLNLTGKEIIGKDALLVFINVFGKWTGLILNNPAGTTAAAIGGNSKNVAQTTTASHQNTDVQLTTNNQIQNDISLTAKSGDATVTNNTKAGNATSGNAGASVNLVNIVDSKISLTDWFGILFINVFGTWQGSFGLNTIAGSSPVNSNTGQTQNNTSTNSTVFKFVPRSNSSSQSVSRISNNNLYQNTQSVNNGDTSNDDQVLAAVTTGQDINPTDTLGSAASTVSGASNIMRQLPFIIGFVCGMLLLVGERLSALRAQQKEIPVPTTLTGNDL